ncbi:hypothetical protein HNQ57_002907 [Zhongshania antarctica]|uniref:Uncharacterized protein n=1 Tax=Zhongshania antarctica TaxID=641702 RepID=A0A840R6X3_9GAMM|nr:hypothetical protein [Zhongshania antarctica]MBB5188617.1 hypothetical protein [Zhongshania antarctica]
MDALKPLFYRLKKIPLFSYFANTLFIAAVLAVILILLAGEGGESSQEREWWWNIH